MRHIDGISWSATWNKSVRTALGNSYRAKGRYHVIRYEDLVENPRDTLFTLCKALRLDFEPDRMLQMSDFERKDNSSFTHKNDPGSSLIRKSDQVDRASLLEPEELKLIRAACAQTAEIVGHDLGSQSESARLNGELA